MRDEDKQIRDQAYQKDKSKLADELFWFILDHDKLHKEHFMPLAKRIKKAQKEKNFDHKDYIKEWLPMVDKACLEYYKLNQLEGAPKDVFTKEFRRDMCHRLADQHHRDIESGEYVLGESGQAQMAGPSGPQYDTTGNQRLESQKQRLDPKCWKGYRKSGTKLKSRGKGKGKIRVNNCVKVSESWEAEISKYVQLLEKKYR